MNCGQNHSKWFNLNKYFTKPFPNPLTLQIHMLITTNLMELNYTRKPIIWNRYDACSIRFFIGIGQFIFLDFIHLRSMFGNAKWKCAKKWIFDDDRLAPSYSVFIIVTIAVDISVNLQKLSFIRYNPEISFSEIKTINWIEFHISFYKQHFFLQKIFGNWCGFVLGQSSTMTCLADLIVPPYDKNKNVRVLWLSPCDVHHIGYLLHDII